MTQATIDELTLSDDPERWESLGFTVTGDVCQIGTVSVRLKGAREGGGILGWSLRDIASTDLDGLPTTRSHAPAPEAADTHPNGTVAIDHVVAMSPCFQRSVDALLAAGLELRRVREEPTPAGAPRQAFFRLGPEILELVQEPEEVVERAGGPDRPARLWGLALRVRDLGTSAELMGEHLGTVRPAVQPGRLIATVRRSAGLHVPLALMSETMGLVAEQAR